MAHRILIVDDTPVNLKLLERILEREGHVVVTTDNGRDAIRLAGTERPDLVLLDVLMPIVDGYAVCSALKRNPATRDIPVVFLSALHDACDKVKGLRLGAVDFITKPFAEGEVLARIATHLGRRRVEAEARSEAQRADRAERRRDAERRRVETLLDRFLPAWPHETRGLRWALAGTGDERPAAAGAWSPDSDHGAAFLVVAGGRGPVALLLAAAAMQAVAVEGGGLGWRGPAGNGSGPVIPPGEVLAALDREFPLERHGCYLSAAYLLLHRGTGLLRYAMAGLAPVALVRGSGTRQVLEEGGTVLGVGAPGETGRAWPEGMVTIETGDRLEIGDALAAARGGDALVASLDLAVPVVLRLEDDPRRAWSLDAGEKRVA